MVEEVRGRSRALAARAISIWPRPDDLDIRETFNEPEVHTAAQRLTDMLMSIPDGKWTTDSALAAVLGQTEDEIRGLVAQTGPESARFVLDDTGEVPSWMPSELSEKIARQTAMLRIGPLAGSPLDSDALASLIAWDEDAGSVASEDED
ncbi:hypothetical protein JS562_50130 [Agrobacterium sp. S2]|nr:hypothetical protein [Agrobacterium sp. S2]